MNTGEMRTKKKDYHNLFNTERDIITIKERFNVNNIKNVIIESQDKVKPY